MYSKFIFFLTRKTIRLLFGIFDNIFIPQTIYISTYKCLPLRKTLRKLVYLIIVINYNLKFFVIHFVILGRTDENYGLMILLLLLFSYKPIYITLKSS